ncbi:hypothetical protein [Sphingomonas sp. UYP23]
MIKHGILAAGIGLFGLASPTGAQQVEQPPLVAEQPALAVLNQLGGAPSDTARLVLLDRALTLLPQPTTLRGHVLCGRAALLSQLHREDEARVGFDQCRQLLPDDPNVLLPIAFDESRRKRPVEAAELTIRAARLKAPGLDHIDADVMATVLRQLAYVGKGDLGETMIDALVAAGYPRDNPVAFSQYAQTAILYRLRSGDWATATQLLPSVLSPRAGVAMLVDRRYAPIWPAIAGWAGTDLAVQRSALLAGARATFEMHETPETRLAYAQALVDTGHRGEAIALIDQWLHTEIAAEKMWVRSMALLRMGRWLAEQGERAEGIRRMRAAVDAPEQLESGIENIVPNLVMQVLLAQDFTGAIELLDRHPPTADKLESPVAAGYFVALRACALQGLGKQDQAKAQLKRLQTVYPSAKAAEDYAVACVAPIDDQARHWIRAARDPDMRTEALVALETARYRAKKGLPALSLTEQMLRRIAPRADVQRTFAEFGRPLPSSYAPALDDFHVAPADMPRGPSPTPVA